MTIATKFFKTESAARNYFTSVKFPADLFSYCISGSVIGYYVEDRTGVNTLMSKGLNQYNLIEQK